MAFPRTPTRALIIAVAAGAAAVTGLAGPASAGGSATGPSAQEQVNAQLRQYPGGVQTGPNEISYKGGRVLLTIPAKGSAAADPCATGAYCFYDGPDFTGRKLTFRDCGGWQYLTDYGFGNKTSSWTNATPNTVKVYDEDVSPRVLLWTENPGAASANVGSGPYNKADAFLTYCP
ncbi:peptidase inhibitor family I36 protein [Actinomadura bangladeshensis]|uniref:Peptidase inhibitor family I36 protein n=1 Tax=Actinomadura bangladeshensis TaxID=453573 RepID=A0A6L9QGG7_9ACTN|nr:peptidase inhibitor family I36 protein [Actinomadura bangladeshensis]NEA24581.1 hypothetical protein [Actinomadura bangladeshensis]